MNSLRSTATYLPAILIPRLTSLGLVIIMTHLLPKAEYGLLTLVVTVGELVDTSLTTWVRLALLRLGAGGMVSVALANVVLTSVVVTTSVGGMLSLLLSLFLVPDQALRFWIAVFLYIASVSLLRFGLTLLQLSERRALYSLLEVLRALLSFTLALTAGYAIGGSFFYPSLAVGGTTGMFALIAARTGYRGLARTARTYRIGDVTAFAGPLLILSVLTIVANAMDRLFLQYFWGAAAVGAYAAVYALARQPVDVLANAINVGGYPALVGHYERGGRPEAATFLRHQLGFFLKFIVPPACVILVMQHDIAGALLPRNYVGQAGSFFWIVLAGAIAFNLRSVIFDNVFLVERRNLLQLRYFVFVFVGGLVVAALGVPRLGVVGAALIFLFWTTLALALSAAFGRQLIAVSVPGGDLARAIVLAAVACAAVVLAQTLAGSKPFVRLAWEALAATIGYGAALVALHRSDAGRLMRSLRGQRA